MKDITSTPFSGYQKLVIFLLAMTQFTVILDFMIMSPLGDMLMKSLSLSPTKFGVSVSAYAFSAGISGLLTGLCRQVRSQEVVTFLLHRVYYRDHCLRVCE